MDSYSAELEMKLIECGQLIDGVADDPYVDYGILVEGNKIAGVKPLESISFDSKISRETHTADTVLPGLIDAHVHLNGDRTFSDPLARYTKSVSLSTARATADLRRLIKAGFTSVRDMGSAGGLGLRDAVNEGEILGPRIWTASRDFSQTAGSGDYRELPFEWNEDMRNLAAKHKTNIDGITACRQAARKTLRAGADLLKVYATGAGYHAYGQSEHPSYSRAELKIFADEAHRRDLPFACHCLGIEGTKNALCAGADTIEHGWYLDNSTVTAFVSNEAILVPTLFVAHRYAHHSTEENSPPGFHQVGGPSEAKIVEDTAITSISNAYQSGVPLALGTDAMGTELLPHGKNANEAKLLHEEIGLSQMEVIKSATSIAAQTLPSADQRTVGRIAKNAYADFVVLDRDPLSDISALSNGVVEVYRNGTRTTPSFSPENGRRE